MATCVSCWKYITLVCVTLQSVNTVSTVQTSKACYGVSGISCTRHYLSCSNTQNTISICDSYYTDNNECGAGVTGCNLNPVGLTEHGYHRFSNKELAPIFDRCSTQTECVYPPSWRGLSRTFSVLKYQCIKTSTPFNNTCEQVQTKGTSGLTTITRNNISSTWITDKSTTTAAGQIETTTNTGAIIGGVVVTVLAASVATFVFVRLIRKRRQRMQETEKKTHNPRVVKTDNTYCLASDIPQSNDNDRGNLKAQNTPSDYDYATVDGMAPLPDTYPTSVPAGRSNTSDSAAFVTDCDYDQIGDKPAPLTSTYDTTASVTQPTSTEGRIGEDEYGYNLFQKTTTETFQNDYDTAASATKAVTQLSRIVQNPDEDNYDHFSRGTMGLNTLGSPYDTAGNL